MFERLLENLLKSVLGEYVDNLDAQKLSVSIWSGLVQLNDLKVRRDLFQKLNLPFNLKLGIIKNLTFEVPWTRLSSQPVVCKLDQFLLILTPQKESEWVMQDVTSYEYKEGKLRELLEKYAQEAKVALAQQLEEELEKIRQKNKKSKKNQKQAQQQAGYFERYITRIVDNLRISIQNIHVRLEDRQQRVIRQYQSDGVTASNLDQCTCIGLTLRELNLEAVPPEAAVAESAWLSGSGDEGDEGRTESNAQQKNEHNGPSLPTSKSSSTTPTEDLEALSQSPGPSSAFAAKQGQKSADKQYFFDSTLRENHGKPLHKRMSISGFAIYIDSGPNTLLLSSPRVLGKDKQLITMEAPSQEQLDKAMMRLNEGIYLDSINWDYVYEIFNPSTAASHQSSQDVVGGLASENKACNYIIRPQSITINLTQQADNFAGSSEASSGGAGPSRKNQPQISSTTTPDEGVKPLASARPKIQLDIHVSDLKLQLQKSQYQTIFRVADQVRRYQWKQDCLNSSKKYKHLRPIYPVTFESQMLLDKLKAEEQLMIQYQDAKAGSPQPRREGNDAKQNQEMEFGDGSDEEFGLMDDDSGKQVLSGEQQLQDPKLTLEDVGVEKVTERLRQRMQIEEAGDILHATGHSSASDSISASGTKARRSDDSPAQEYSAEFLDAEDESVKRERSTRLADIYKARLADKRRSHAANSPQSAMTRQQIIEQKIDISKRANRQILHRVATNNVHAKAWWQFAILCVIKDNRQIAHGKFHEYVVSKAQRDAHQCIISYFLAKFIDQHEQYVLDRQSGKKKGSQHVQGEMKKEKEKKDKNASIENTMDFVAAVRSLDECDKHLFIHAVQATRVADFDDWAKTVTKKKLLQDELRRFRIRQHREAQTERQKLNKERSAQSTKSSEAPLRDAGPSSQQIQPAVRKTYGASILSYMTYWGGSSKSSQSAIEQQKEAEKAVEAVALAEQERANEMDESLLNQPMDTELEAEQENDHDYGDYEGVFDQGQDRGAASLTPAAQYKLRVRCRLDRGSVILESICEDESLILFFQNVKADFQSKKEMQKLRVRTFNWGINHVTLPKNRFSQPIIKPLVQVKKRDSTETSSIGDKYASEEQNAWNFAFTMKSDQEIQSQSESLLPAQELQNQPQIAQKAPLDPTADADDHTKYIQEFDAREIQVDYEPLVIQNLTKFFKLDEADELAAHALDKLVQVSEQSQVNFREMIQQQKLARFTFNIDKVTVVVPFKAHNSTYVNEPEELRERAWQLIVVKLNIQSIPNTSFEDVYQKLRISLGSIGLRMSKRSYPHPIRVIEDFAVDFLLQIKSKLKAMMLQEKINHNKEEIKDPSTGGALTVQSIEELAEVKISTTENFTDDCQLECLTLNLTPDAYNSLINISTVLYPESTRAEVLRQMDEKQSILRASSFKQTLHAQGLKQNRLTNTWKSFFVVLSGSYIYFYKNKNDLMPIHYMYVMSIIVQDLTTASGQQQSAALASRGRTSTMKQPFSSGSNQPDTMDCLLLLKGRNGEQVLLNFGQVLKKRRDTFAGSSHTAHTLAVPQQDQNVSTSILSADHDMSFKSLSNTSGLSSSQRSEADDSGHFRPQQFAKNSMKQYQDTERQKSLFQNLIHSKQQEFRTTNVEYVDSEQIINVAGERVSKLIKYDVDQTGDQQKQFNQLAYSLVLNAKKILLRLFKDDHAIMNNHVVDYEGHQDVWTTLRKDDVRLNYKMHPFDSTTDLFVGSLSVREHQRLNRQLLLVPQESQITIKQYSINSPTIKDCGQEFSASLGGKPVMLLDPAFFNQLIRYLRNVSNQSSESAIKITEQLLNEDAKKKSQPDLASAEDQGAMPDEQEIPTITSTCQNVDLILQRTRLDVKEGLNVIGCHHLYTASPFMELQLDSLSIVYDNHYDHDELDGVLTGVIFNDLTMWPKTIIPQPVERCGHLDKQEHFDNVITFSDSLKRQRIMGPKYSDDEGKPSSIKLKIPIYYPTCPFFTPEVQMINKIMIDRVAVHYFQEQFLRVISYFTNRFLPSLTDTDPYAEFKEKESRQKMSEEEINEIKDLKQSDKTMDLLLEWSDFTFTLRERPYLSEQQIDINVERVDITMLSDVLKGRHSNHPDLEMKMTKLLYKLTNITIKHINRKRLDRQELVVSNQFNADFSMMYPSYSVLLEQISSSILDKSSEYVISLHPQVKITLSQELFTFIMRCNSLNLGFVDQWREYFEFNLVNEIFQSQENLLFLRTKIEIAKDIILSLEQDEEEIVELRIRNCQSSQKTQKAREIVRIDQFLDKQMKVLMQMGIPTIWNPSEKQAGAGDGVLNRDDLATEVKNLLVGTESDPHHYQASLDEQEAAIELDQSISIVDLDVEEKAEKGKQPAPQKGSSSKPGKFLFKLNWTSDGQQQIECKIDKVKVFVRPYYFLMIAHFFSSGYPEFDLDSFECPNYYETDFEKLPILKMKVEVLDSMICIDSFKSEDVLDFMKNKEFFEHEARVNRDTWMQMKQSMSVISENFGQPPSEQLLQDLQNQLRRGQHPSESLFDDMQFEQTNAEHQTKESFAAQGGRWSQHFTTIVCRTQLIEYKYSRDQISQVKEKLYEKMKEHAQSRQEEIQEEAQDGEGTGGQDWEESKENEDGLMRDSPEQNATSIAESNLRFQENYIGGQRRFGEEDSGFEEVASDHFLRMQIRVRQFSPYICESLDLDANGFENIQKRQLISPVDATFTHSKLLKVEIEEQKLLNKMREAQRVILPAEIRPARFTAFQKNDIHLDKTLLKVTFSDVLILQETSSKILESQAKYDSYLLEYLRKKRKEEVKKNEQLGLEEHESDEVAGVRPPGQTGEQDQDNSQKVEGLAKMLERQSNSGQRETITSFRHEASGSFKSSTSDLVEDEIHMEATQVAAQQRSYFVSMMTGVSTSQRPSSHKSIKRRRTGSMSSFEYEQMISKDTKGLHQHSLKVGGAASGATWQGLVSGSERSQSKMSSSMRILDGLSSTPLLQTQFVQRYKVQRGSAEDQAGLPTVRHLDVHYGPIKEEDEDDLDDDAKSQESDTIMSKKMERATSSKSERRGRARAGKDVHEVDSNNEEFYSIKTSAQNLMPEDERPQTESMRASTQDQELRGRHETVVDYQKTTLARMDAESFLEPPGVLLIENTQEIENEPSVDDEDGQEGASDDDDERSEDSEGLINWDIDYGDQDSYSGVQFRTSVTLSGIHMMIINDQDNIFYPILQMNVEKVKLVLENEIFALHGETDINIMISYYNNKIDVWEPLLERTNLSLSIEQDEYSSLFYTCFKSAVNLNITEELIQNLIFAYLSLEKTKKAEEMNQKRQQAANLQRQQTINQRRASQVTLSKRNESTSSFQEQAATSFTQPQHQVHRESQAQKSTRSSHLHMYTARQRKEPKAQVLNAKKAQPAQKKVNLEFKVTPYRIMNMTSKSVVIRRKDIQNVMLSKKKEQEEEQILLKSSAITQPAVGPAEENLRPRHQSRQGQQTRGVTGRHQVRQSKQADGSSVLGAEKARGTSRPVHEQRNNHIPHKYVLEQGVSVDYEVDYEQEAKQLVLTSEDDFVRKQDYIDIVFEEGTANQDKIRHYNLANLDTHRHVFSQENYDFVVYGMVMTESNVRKTFMMRSPFIIYNKTNCTYMLKISKSSRTKEKEKVLQIAPGDGYPLSHLELLSKIMFSTYKDYQEAQSNQYAPEEQIWSSPFRVCNFYEKRDIQKKKFFVYHKQKFSMIFVQPTKFKQAWDICIKVPMIIKNALPFNLKILTSAIKQYQQTLIVNQSQPARKHIQYEAEPVETIIPRQGRQYYHNFNLDNDVNFKMTLLCADSPAGQGPEQEQSQYMAELAKFTLSRDEYKCCDKKITLFDPQSGQTLDIGARIKSTEQTDLEITFYCYNCFVNNTDQAILLWSSEGKKVKVPCQSTSNFSIIPLSEKISKVQASIESDQSHGAAAEGQKLTSKHFSSAFPVDLVGISNKISIMKQKNQHFDFILNTTYSLVTPTDDIYIKITTINPQYIIVNQTKIVMLVAQKGFQDKFAEVIPDNGRMPLSWTDPKSKQRLLFKFAPEVEGLGFDETVYEWSRKIKPYKIGRISIYCHNKHRSEESKHVKLIKQVHQKTQTTYLIFKIEDEKQPTYRIDNQSESIQLEYFQQGVNDPWRSVLGPGQRQIYSWTDPEQRKQTSRVLSCHLNLINDRGEKLKTMQKLEIKLDNLKYSRTFIGKFIKDEQAAYQAGSIKISKKSMARLQKKQATLADSKMNTDNKKSSLLSQAGEAEFGAIMLPEVAEKIIQVQIVTDGFTKTLRVTERSRNDVIPQALQDESFFIKDLKERRGGSRVLRRSSTVTSTEDLVFEQSKKDNQLQSIDESRLRDPYELEAETDRENKFQLDVAVIYISFVASNERKVRREFMLVCLQALELLVVSNEKDKSIQLRVADFQVDNNINTDGKALFPYMMYPKEVLNPPQNQKTRSLSRFRQKKQLRRDFFNMHICIKNQPDNGLAFVQRIEFLLQSVVLQLDEDLLGWIFRFVECFASTLGKNITGVHPILLGDEIFPSKDVATVAPAAPSYLVTHHALDEPPDGNLEFDGAVLEHEPPRERAAKAGLFSSLALGPDPLSEYRRQHAGASRELMPEKRMGVTYGYSAFYDRVQNLSHYALKSQDSWLNHEIKLENPIFIQELKLSPIDVEMTYQPRTRTTTDTQIFDGPMKSLGNIGISVVSLEKAGFRLNSLEVQNVYGTAEEIETVLMSHYRHRVMKNVFGLLMSTNVLGNLNLLGHDIGTGAKDFFYKPYEGFIDGPMEGGKGLVLGTASLLGNTAKGGLGTISRVVGSMSKGLLYFSGDDDYLEHREQESHQARPGNVLTGVAYGLKSVAVGVGSGVAGVVKQPYRGAKQGGVKGFLKGTAKGLGGVVAKPISGSLDFISKTTEGASNMVNIGGRKSKKQTKDSLMSSARLTESVADRDAITMGPLGALAYEDESLGHSSISSENQIVSSSRDQQLLVQKIRMFRPFYGRDQRIKSYQEFQASVALHLKFLADGDYADDHFLDAIIYDSGSNKYCVILTEERILIVDALSKERVEDYEAADLHGVEVRPVFAHEEEVHGLQSSLFEHRPGPLAQSMYTVSPGDLEQQQLARPRIQIGYELVLRVYTDQFQGANAIKDIIEHQEALKAKNLLQEQSQIQISGQLPGELSPTTASYFKESQEAPKAAVAPDDSPKPVARPGGPPSPRFGARTPELRPSVGGPPEGGEGQKSHRLGHTAVVDKLKGKMEQAGALIQKSKKKDVQRNRTKKLIVDGFAFFLKKPENLQDFKTKLENYLWYLQMQRNYEDKD